MFGKLRSAGVDLVYISGTRSLYTRAGAAECGAYRNFMIRAGRLSAAGRGLSVTKGGLADATFIATSLAADPAHFADTPADVRAVLRTGLLQCRTSTIVLYGGQRLPVAALLPEIVRRAKLGRLSISIPAWDTELISLVVMKHGKGTPAGLQGPGTILILDPARLCRRLGLPPVRARTPRALAALTRKLFGAPGSASAPVPLPLIGVRYM
jgi:hypothetical protein